MRVSIHWAILWQPEESDLTIDFDISGRHAVVTGASSGIGRAIALGLARSGASVGCLAPASDRLDDVVSAINRAGGTARAWPIDVRDEKSVDEAMIAADAELGPLTLAVNSAGIANAAQATEMSTAQWQNVLDVNLTGIFVSCRAEARLMKLAGGGAIVNIASMSGSIANRGLYQAHYNASKAGVIHMGRSLAWEFASFGVRVNTVSPGYTLTPMSSRPEQISLMEGYAANTPLMRNAVAEEIVGPVSFLLSDAASFVTGVDLLVDGGFTIW